MKAQRVLVLVHPTLIPPATLAGVSERQYDEWRTEFDVISTLRESGHDVKVVGADDSLDELREVLRDWQPQTVFNLLEEFHGTVSYEQHVVAWLELLCQPYTGCNPRGLMIARDKVLCKQVLSAHGIRTPAFVLWKRGARAPTMRQLAYPLFVKSATEDASLGISQSSVTRNAHQLRQRVTFMHQQIGCDALVEEYVAGHEYYVAVLGNQRLQSFPVWELQFGRMPASNPAIATHAVKWDRKYQRKYGIGTRRAEPMPTALAAQLGRAARQVFRALGLSGYARIDFRRRTDGTLYVLEANPNPNLARIEDFATSGAAAGLAYPALLERIMKTGQSYRAAWRATQSG
jgi:D-alanine-D-alanine ligase